MFTKDGYYHACIDINNCQCDYAKDVKYIRKNNVIYFNIKNSVSDDYWQITNYVVDDYLFTPELYKVEEQQLLTIYILMQDDGTFRVTKLEYDD